MLTAASFFEKFKGRGLLYSTVWTPAGGGAGATFDARLMRGSGSTIPQIGAAEPAIQFIATDATGISQGDTVALNGKTYKLRERDLSNCSADGTLLAFAMREVAA